MTSSSHTCSASHLPRFLFLLKRTEGSGYGHPRSGLQNSARFVADMLAREGLALTEVTVVTDGNDIDREVSRFNARVVVLEAIWCPPAKLAELAALWPSVRWIVRVHSEIPFLANEGIALEWLFAYSSIPNVAIAANSDDATADLCQQGLRTQYLPNYYPIVDAYRERAEMWNPGVLNVGCFGAIRPMKNQLAQAFAAIAYAKEHKCELRFFINSSRTEQGGNSVLKNLRAVFAVNKGFMLIEAGWLDHAEFQGLLGTMDVSMNVSMTETFCITAADAVSQSVPVLTSGQVHWTDERSHADPTSIASMVDGLANVLGRRRQSITTENYKRLAEYDRYSVLVWRNLAAA
jgi:hypothetical protein